MRLEPISNINFGIYKKTITKSYGHVDVGEYRDKIIDIYHAYCKEDNSLMHKLYYIKDRTGKWLMSRLKYFYNGKCNQIINSSRINKTYV